MHVSHWTSIVRHVRLESRHANESALVVSASAAVGRTVWERFFSESTGTAGSLLDVRDGRRRFVCRQGKESEETIGQLSRRESRKIFTTHSPAAASGNADRVGRMRRRFGGVLPRGIADRGAATAVQSG